MNHKHRFYPSVEIPETWSPDQALTIVAFLKRLTSAIWAAHGPGMAELLCHSIPATPATAIPFSPCNASETYYPSDDSEPGAELHDNEQTEWPF